MLQRLVLLTMPGPTTGTGPVIRWIVSRRRGGICCSSARADFQRGSTRRIGGSATIVCPFRSSRNEGVGVEVYTAS